MTQAADCVLVYSGGLDSTVLLHELVSNGRHPFALSFDYSSRHNHKELKLAAKNCLSLGVEHKIIPLSFIGELFASALLKSGPPVPDGKYMPENLAQTVVPFRNPIMMSVATGFAESIGAFEVLLASHAGDHQLYPDCRPEFNQAFAKAVYLGTDQKVTLSFPYQGLNKRAIADRGRSLGVDFLQTWTCYKGGTIHCGGCSACLERRHALRQEEGLDPTEYSRR